MQDLGVSLYSKPSLLKWACIILFALSDILGKASIGMFQGFKTGKMSKNNRIQWTNPTIMKAMPCEGVKMSES